MSSNVSEVIRAVLNFLIFLRKDFARTKSTKRTKNTKSTKTIDQNANMRISDFFPLDAFYAHLFCFCLLICVFVLN